MNEKRSKHGPRYSSSKNVCPICGFIAAYSFTLKDHILRRHTKERPVKCTECSASFVTRPELTKHIRFHHTEDLAYKCQVCEKKFKSNSQKRKHEDEEHKIEIPCKLCKAVFYKQIELSYHRRLVHGSEHKVENGFSCDICFRVFFSRKHLTNHKVQHKSYVCSICSLKLANPNDLLSHKRIAHSIQPTKRGRSAFEVNDEISRDKLSSILTMKDKSTFECNICHSFFYRRKHFFSHVESDHPDLIEKLCPYVCNICSKKYHLAQNLRNHMAIHKNNRKFQCNLCNYSSVRSGDLSSHKRVVHSINKLECNLCDEKFSHYSALKCHVNKHLGNKEFKCTICGLEFYKKDKLLSHVATHKNIEDNYEHLCPICGFKSKSRLSFQAHLKRHNDTALVSSIPKLLSDRLVKIISPENKCTETIKKENETLFEITDCLQCKATFSNKTLWFWHSYCYHNKIYECFTCGQCLLSEEDLYKHLSSHVVIEF